MTGNIIVSTCCLGDIALNAPESEGASPSQTCANYYLVTSLAHINSNTKRFSTLVDESKVVWMTTTIATMVKLYAIN